MDDQPDTWLMVAFLVACLGLAISVVGCCDLLLAAPDLLAGVCR